MKSLRMPLELYMTLGRTTSAFLYFSTETSLRVHNTFWSIRTSAGLRLLIFYLPRKFREDSNETY